MRMRTTHDQGKFLASRLCVSLHLRSVSSGPLTTWLTWHYQIIGDFTVNIPFKSRLKELCAKKLSRLHVLLQLIMYMK